MKRTKVNDYCEFPMTLNMAPYTLEGLAEKEKSKLPQSQTLQDPSYYEYELAGILVHTGTADSGHYYSYIRVIINCKYLLTYNLGERAISSRSREKMVSI